MQPMTHETLKSTHDRFSSFPANYYKAALSVILLLGFTVRVAAFLDLKSTVYFDFLLWDELVYHQWAEKIAAGTFDSDTVYAFAPLPAYLMAMVYRIFSPDIVFIRWMNIGLGTLTCLLIYFIGVELKDRRTGILAALVAALYKPFIFYSIVPLKAALSTFLFAGFVLFLVRSIKRSAWIASLISGILLGLMVNVRPQVLVLLPCVPPALAWIQRKNSINDVLKLAGCWAIGVLIAVSPFLIRNVRMADTWALTTTQTGFNLYQANRTDGDGPVAFATTSPLDQGVQFTIEASRRKGETLSPGGASRYWIQETWNAMKERPAVFLKNTWWKTVYFFQQYQRTDHYHLGFLSEFVTFFSFPLFAWWLVMPIGMAGLISCLRQSQVARMLGLVFLLYGMTQVLFFTATRYRLPLLVILIPFGAIGVQLVFDWIRTHRWRALAVYAGALMLAFGLSQMPTPRSGDITTYLNTHAIALHKQGRTAEALKYWGRSAQSGGLYAVFAELSLTGRHVARGELAEADRRLRRIPDSSFVRAHKYELIGDLWLRRGDPWEAVWAYERALATNSGMLGVRMKKVRILQRIDPESAAPEYRILKYIESFYTGYGLD